MKIQPIKKPPPPNNWGSSLLAADLYDNNRKEVARATFAEAREVTVTFAPSNPFAAELSDMQVRAELHLGAGGVAYVVPVEPSILGSVVHVTCKTISVRLYSGVSAATAKAQPRVARWQVGIALGTAVKQPARVGNINQAPPAPATYLIHRLRPWTNAYQIIPVDNGVWDPLDMTQVMIHEVNVTDEAPGTYGSFSYPYAASLAVSTPMPLQPRCNALQLRIPTGMQAQSYFHLIEHWQL